MNEENRSTTHSLMYVESTDSNVLPITEIFTTKFDYIIKRDMYRPHNNTLAVYDLVRQIICDKKQQIKTPIITLSPDSAISSSTIAGVAEKFMYTDSDGDKTNFKSSAKVIYIDSTPDMSTKKYTNYSDFVNSIVSDVLGLTDSSFSMHRVNISPENLFLVGIDEDLLNDDQDGFIRKYNINMFTYQNMIKKGIDKIMNSIIDQCKYDTVHIVIDLSVISPKYAPSVYREDNAKNGFDFDQMIMIMKILKNIEKINSIDITGYNFGSKNDHDKYHIANILTIKMIEMIINTFINLKSKSINIFDEESRFLIWKRLDDIDPIGWLILRNISLQEREDIIKEIGDDKIITIPIEDEEDTYVAFVTATTMKEQQEKSYYMSTNVYDCCLYPGEKLSMMFELINTPNILSTQEFSNCAHTTASIQINTPYNNDGDYEDEDKEEDNENNFISLIAK